MEIVYKELLTIVPQHSYYASGVSEDFRYLFDHNTANYFSNGRVVAKRDQGKLSVYAQTRSGALVGDVSGKRLLIGLVLTNPHFYNFTVPPVTTGAAVYTNHDAPRAFGYPVGNRLIGQRFTHKISSAIRPVTLRLMRGDQMIETDTYSTFDAISEFNYLLTEANLGQFEVEEIYPSETIVHHYFSSDLAFREVSVLLSIDLQNSFLTDPPVFNLNFSAKLETLSYYIVARNYGNDFNQIAIAGSDNMVAETPVAITFDKVTPSNFNSTHLTKEKLGVTDQDSKLVLFHSSNPISRRDKPNMNIQLSKNGETLIPKLPLSGPDRISADFIVHLSKPKT